MTKTSTLLLSACFSVAAMAQSSSPPPAAAAETATKPQPPPPAPPPSAILAKWSTSFYGFVELDAISDSTQSGWLETIGNTAVTRPNTYAATHKAMKFGVRNSRVGFRIGAPEFSGMKVSAVIEADFFGNQPSDATEAATFVNPTFRIRQGLIRMESEYIDVWLGQTWALYGWQPYFAPNSVEIQGLPAQTFNRAPQIRLAHTFKTDPVNVEVAIAAVRPPQRNGALPDGQAGIRAMFNSLKGVHTVGQTGTTADSAMIGVSGAIRRFVLPELTATPVNDISMSGSALAVDLWLPIIPATMQNRGNALSVNAEFSTGTGLADLYSSLNGGVNLPATIPGGTAAYSPNIDRGLVGYNAATQALNTVDWRMFIAGLQWFLPPDGKLMISGNFSQSYSGNISDFGAAASLFNHAWFADANMFYDFTPAWKIGLEYAYHSQTYADGVNATNHRLFFASWFLF